MKPDEYICAYPQMNQWSMAKCIDMSPRLFEQLKNLRVAEWKQHAKLEEILSYEIVKCGKVWVLLGKVLEHFTYVYTEVAFGIDKNELGIWADLHLQHGPMGDSELS